MGGSSTRPKLSMLQTQTTMPFPLDTKTLNHDTCPPQIPKSTPYYTWTQKYVTQMAFWAPFRGLGHYIAYFWVPRRPCTLNGPSASFILVRPLTPPLQHLRRSSRAKIPGVRGSLLPRPPNEPLLRASWSLLDGIWGALEGSWGVLVEEHVWNELYAFQAT